LSVASSPISLTISRRRSWRRPCHHDVGEAPATSGAAGAIVGTRNAGNAGCLGVDGDAAGSAGARPAACRRFGVN
jgi:hypothetical protein